MASELYLINSWSMGRDIQHACHPVLWWGSCLEVLSSCLLSYAEDEPPSKAAKTDTAGVPDALPPQLVPPLQPLYGAFHGVPPVMCVPSQSLRCYAVSFAGHPTSNPSWFSCSFDGRGSELELDGAICRRFFIIASMFRGNICAEADVRAH